MELSEFLLARIAEDEAAARAAIQHPVRADADAVYVRWSRHDTGWVPSASGEWTEGSALFARFDPARVLAEVEAKRRIVELHAVSVASVWVNPPDGPAHQEPERTCAICGWVPDACDTVKALALPYSDHPDYNPAWRA